MRVRLGALNADTFATRRRKIIKASCVINADIVVISNHLDEAFIACGHLVRVPRWSVQTSKPRGKCILDKAISRVCIGKEGEAIKERRALVAILDSVFSSKGGSRKSG